MSDPASRPVPLVSILIPCHNAGRWVAQTLASALNQTWPRKEILLVDDGSSDDSVRIARSFEKRGVRILLQEHRGAAAARNLALASSGGDYLQFLDADDLLAHDKIARQMLTAAAHGTEAIYSGAWGRFQDDPSGADMCPQPLCADSDPVDWVVTKLELHAMMHPGAWLVPRRLAEKSGPWDESLTLDDDGEYFTRLVLHAAGVRHCPGAISFYRSQIAGGSLSGARSERAWASAFHSIELTAGRLLKAEVSPRTRHACATAFQRFIYESYPRASASRAQAAIRVRELGGTELQPEGGPRFQAASRLLGWRLAKRLQLLR